MKRLLCILCLFALLLAALACAHVPANGGCRFYFLDVGQGDSLLIRTPSGDILIDAGTESSEAQLCLRLEQLGVTALRLAIFTHTDDDHIGGADAVLARFPAQEIWLSAAPLENEAAERLLNAALATNAKVCRVGVGTVLTFDNIAVSVLAPFGELSDSGNENSLILRVQHGEVVAMITGDADSKAEAELIAQYGHSQLACDLYKVGHHGSNTSSTWKFLQAMQPTYAVISCGAANSYGHPTGEVLARLEAAGAQVLRTDLCGEIVFESNGQALVCLSHP